MAAAKKVDAVFSTATVAETRGGRGEGRQRTTGVGENKVDGRLKGGDGESVRTRRRDQWRETATSRPWWQQRMASKQKEAADDAGVDAGETEEKRPSGNRERRHWWLGLCIVEKETVEKEEADVDGCDDELGRRGGLMKTETRPTATEKSEGHEDPHVVGDGKEEEGERDSGGDEVCRRYGDNITEEKGSGVCGGGREGRKGRHGGGRGRRGRRDRGVAGGREGEEGGEAGADGKQREEQRQTATLGVKERRRWNSAR